MSRQILVSVFILTSIYITQAHAEEPEQDAAKSKQELDFQNRHDSVPAPSISHGDRFVERENAKLKDEHQIRELQRSGAFSEINTLIKNQKVAQPANERLGGNNGLTDAQGRAVDPAGPNSGSKQRYRHSLEGLTPKLPRNSDVGPSNSGLLPSTSPSNWRSGITSKNKQPEEKQSAGKQTGGLLNEDDRYTTTIKVKDDGQVVERTIIVPAYSSAAVTVTYKTTREDGSGYISHQSFDHRGRLIYERFLTYDSGGRVTSAWSRDTVNAPNDPYDDTELYRGTIVRTIDPNSDNYTHEFAIWVSQFDHSRKSSGPTINYVDPGPEVAHQRAEASKLVLSELQLLGNPDPNNVRAMGSHPTSEQRRLLQEELRSAAKGPGGRPPKPTDR